MKTFLLAIALFSTVSSFAQAKEQEELVEQYCRIYISGKLFTDRVQIEADFGEKKRDKKLRDEQKKILTFNSEVDALNHMGKEGWKLMHVQVLPSRTGSTTYYLFKKEVPLEFAFEEE